MGDVLIKDISLGNVICFYDCGWRHGIVTKIQKKRKTKKNPKEHYVIFTENYGKVPLSKVRQVYEYVNNKTVKKTLISELFK